MITVVIPCLNEELALVETCRSLGFGVRGQVVPADARLILVDNGSTDNTLGVARQIQAESPDGSVLIGSESERGYVPPRARGVEIAKTVATESKGTADSVFILQADADTCYDAGYIEAMREASNRCDRGILLNARSDWPEHLPDEMCELARYLEAVDSSIDTEDFSEWDVVVDDKCCGYWLADYLTWGGHQREFDSRGDEIHGETTRLYMRAKAFGGVRLLVESAVARHSTRRWLENSLKEFASAGFPREKTWQERWAGKSKKCDFFPAFSAPLDGIWAAALAERHKHLIALFRLLPMHVANSMQSDSLIEGARPEFDLRFRTVKELREHPALLLEDVFRAAGIS
jgi:glycosyltransferase involved in cell wall biosynthesis